MSDNKCDQIPRIVYGERVVRLCKQPVEKKCCDDGSCKAKNISFRKPGCQEYRQHVDDNNIRLLKVQLPETYTHGRSQQKESRRDQDAAAC